MTPDGRVLHSVTGPVKASVLMQEAQWALELYEQAKELDGNEQLTHIAAAHQRATWTPASGQDKKVHELFAGRPLPHLQTVYREVFEDILGQRVSKAGPRLAQAAVRLEYAKKNGRPILFVLHDGKTWSNPAFDMTTQQLISQYVVIVMPLRESPALSQLTNQPPFEVSSSARPLFVVTRSDCQQLYSVAGWNEGQLVSALSSGYADALDRNPPDIRTLVRAQRLLRKANNDSAADRVRDVTVRVNKEKQKAREAQQEAERLATT